MAYYEESLRDTAKVLNDLPSLAASAAPDDKMKDDISSMTAFNGAASSVTKFIEQGIDPDRAKELAFLTAVDQMPTPLSHVIDTEKRMANVEKSGRTLIRSAQELSSGSLFAGTNAQPLYISSGIEDVRAKLKEANLKESSLMDTMYEGVDWGKTSSMMKLQLHQESRAYELAAQGLSNEDMQATLDKELEDTYGSDVSKLLKTDGKNLTEEQTNLLNLMLITPDQLMADVSLSLKDQEEKLRQHNLMAGSGLVFKKPPGATELAIFAELGVGAGLLATGPIGLVIDTSIGMYMALSGNDVFQSFFHDEEVTLSPGMRTFIGTVSALPAVGSLFKYGSKAPKMVLKSVSDQLGVDSARKMFFGTNQEALDVLATFKRNSSETNAFNDLMIQMRQHGERNTLDAADYEIIELLKAVDKSDADLTASILARNSEPVDSVVSKAARLAAVSGDREAQRVLHELVSEALSVKPRATTKSTGVALPDGSSVEELVSPAKEAAIRVLSRTDKKLADTILRDTRIMTHLPPTTTLDNATIIVDIGKARHLGQEVIVDPVYKAMRQRIDEDYIVSTEPLLYDDFVAETALTIFTLKGRNLKPIPETLEIGTETKQLKEPPLKGYNYKPIEEVRQIGIDQRLLGEPVGALKKFPTNARIGDRLYLEDGSDVVVEAITKDRVVLIGSDMSERVYLIPYKPLGL